MGFFVARGSTWSWTDSYYYPVANPPDSNSRLAWSTTITGPKFDESYYGQLLQIDILLEIQIDVTMQAENTDNYPKVLTFDYDGAITLYRPGLGAMLTQASVSYDNSFNATLYDEIDDYGGTSGKTYRTLESSQSLFSSSDQEVLNIFIGTGDVGLPLSAVDTAFVTGAGNYAQNSDTFGGARVTVIYTFVPEPAASGVAASVFLCTFLLLRRMHRRK